MSQPNALIHETSPYLHQHAHNPVHWYPWGETALKLAQQTDKPILLSIGYSACHWCHVMAHESFEDPAIAEIMNQHFVNIKVDREERPDLDKIYQLTHQVLTERPGGWPLTVFLTPDNHYPFFSGTYFPPRPFHGLPAFDDLLKKVAVFFQEHRQEIEKQNQSLSTFFKNLDSQPAQSQLSESPIQQTTQQLLTNFDSESGGFGSAPKFPHLSNLNILLQILNTQPSTDQQTTTMLLFTLEKMALGGIYDQLKGGFYRYSVDDLWMIPHFEKMLYDNGPFIGLYSEAWQFIKDSAHAERYASLFHKTALETADWVLAEMQSPEGGFYATLDADSEGQEGKFYIWQRQEVKTLLDDTTYELIAPHFGINRPPNFEGYWHLYVQQTLKNLAQQHQLSLTEVQKIVDHGRSILLAAREKRQRPHRDEKILVAWNALMIKGLATASRIFDQPQYLQAAEQALDFIRDTLWVEGRLLAVYKEGRAHLNAYLDDYAFLLDAILHVLQARWRTRDLEWAIDLAEVLLQEFADEQGGGFYFTAYHHEDLIARLKSFSDDSLPSGSGVAAMALGRLGYLLADTRYLTIAEKTLQASWENIISLPYAHASLLQALIDYFSPPQIIILRGQPQQLATWQQICQQHYDSQRLCFAIPDSEAETLPESLAAKQAQGDIVAYICNGLNCSHPINSKDEFYKNIR